VTVGLILAADVFTNVHIAATAAITAALALAAALAVTRSSTRTGCEASRRTTGSRE